MGHPKSGLCSNHDPDLVSRKLIDNLILQVEKNHSMKYY